MIGSPHPSVGCSCAVCDVIRAADLLAQSAEKQEAWRRWLPFRARTPNRRAEN